MSLKNYCNAFSFNVYLSSNANCIYQSINSFRQCKVFLTLIIVNRFPSYLYQKIGAIRHRDNKMNDVNVKGK